MESYCWKDHRLDHHVITKRGMLTIGLWHAMEVLLGLVRPEEERRICREHMLRARKGSRPACSHGVHAGCRTTVGLYLG